MNTDIYENQILDILRELTLDNKLSFSNIEIFKYRFYPYTEDELTSIPAQEERQLCSPPGVWDIICLNENIDWKPELVKKVEDRVNWRNLSINNSIEFTLEFIEEFIDKWDWLYLSRNSVFINNRYLVEEYKDRISLVDYIEFSDETWNKDTLNCFFSKKNYQLLVFLPIEVIENINKFKLLEDESVKIKVIDTPMLWDIRVSFISDEGSSRSNRFKREKPIRDIEKTLIVLKEEYIKKGYSWWHGTQLIHNPTTSWSVSLIEKYKSYLDLGYESDGGICRNTGSFWSEEILYHFRESWNWSFLSRNPGIHWSEDLLIKFKDYIDWNTLLYNLGNTNHNLYPRYRNLIEFLNRNFPKNEFNNFYNECFKESIIWSWLRSISSSDVSKEYYRKAKNWRRKPLLKLLDQKAENAPVETCNILESWILKQVNDTTINVFLSIYGPSRVTPYLFITFLSNLYLEGESEYIRIFKNITFENFDRVIGKRLQNLFLPLYNVMSKVQLIRINEIITEKINDNRNNHFNKLHPLLWTCFPKKEFSPPIWDITPGKSCGPLVLGMDRSTVAEQIGQPDTIDKYEWEYHINGHIQLKYGENGLLEIITIDRVANWGSLGFADSISRIYHFKCRLYGRLLFDEYPSSLENHIVKSLGDENEVEIDRTEYKYPVYRNFNKGIAIEFFTRDYMGYPVTRVEIF